MPPECWKTETLGDYAKVIMGQSPESQYYTTDCNNMPFLQGNRTFGSKYPSFDTYTTKVTKLAPKGSVIISVRAPVGDTNVAPSELCLGRGVAALQSEDPDNEFLYYLVKSLVPLMNQNENGSTFGSINRTDLEKLPINLPDYEERYKIGQVLSALDSKIELNQQINANLWTIILAYFKHILSTNSSSLTPLSEVTNSITDGVHNTVKDDPNGPAYLLSCKNIKNGHLNIGNSERKISLDTFNKLRKRTKLAKGDILLTSVGTIGETHLVMNDPDNIEFQRSVALIKPNPSIISSEYLYLAINYCKSDIINTAHGAVQQCIFINDVCSIEVPLVHFDVINRFTETVSPLFEIIHNNNELSKRLESIRDIILPKLMTGEIDVSQLDLGD